MGWTAGSSGKKPHAVCVPYPSQGHISPMMKVAKLLHARGFHVTFVNTVFNHCRLLRSLGPHALDGLPSFRFESIPDGLPATHVDATQDIPALCVSVRENCLDPFRELLRRMNQESFNGGDVPPPVSCVVSDGMMSFTLDAAQEVGVPEVVFWTTSACAFMAYLHFHQLLRRGLFPLKDEKCLTNGYLDTMIDWIPSMKNMRLKDFPSFVRTTNSDDIMFNYKIHVLEQAKRASAIIVNTFDGLEHDIIQSMSTSLPPIYTIGPLQLLEDREIKKDSDIGRLGSSLWKEDTDCLTWLDTKLPHDVVYVNFGSITVMTEKQLIEFAWGLAGSGKQFLWVIRPDLVARDATVLPIEFLTETAERGMLARWCPQEKVLSHPAIGVFLTHSGWNSTLESLSGGVPVICWPFFADQQTNCKFCCEEWGVGMEIGGDVKREEVQGVVIEMMDGEKGKKVREKAKEWRRMAEEATEPPYGSSFMNFEKVAGKILLGKWSTLILKQ